MSGWFPDVVEIMTLMVSGAALFALTAALAVVVERLAFGVQQAVGRHVTRRFGQLMERALEGDAAALAELSAAPGRYRVALAWLLIVPLIANRNPERIANARAIAEVTGMIPMADRYMRSRLWWRRALALRSIGLVQATGLTGRMVAALDDPNVDVRAAALDALTDLRDPSAIPAILARIHDSSLHRGRRGAALRAFGSQCEPLLLDMSALDLEHRLNYSNALAICGTARSRPALCRWTHDPRIEVRVAAFEALGYIGLDAESARAAIEGLGSDDAPVREMAAFALRGWQGHSDAAASLAKHLDDTWAVAVRAARTLESMGQAGITELRACATRSDLAGTLARQMLWHPAPA